MAGNPKEVSEDSPKAFTRYGKIPVFWNPETVDEGTNATYRKVHGAEMPYYNPKKLDKDGNVIYEFERSPGRIDANPKLAPQTIRGSDAIEKMIAPGGTASTIAHETVHHMQVTKPNMFMELLKAIMDHPTYKTFANSMYGNSNLETQAFLLTNSLPKNTDLYNKINANPTSTSYSLSTTFPFVKPPVNPMSEASVAETQKIMYDKLGKPEQRSLAPYQMKR